MQRARDQQIEIGDQRAEPRQLSGTADQALMRRVVLIDDRRAALLAVVDDDVDPIAAKPRILDIADERGRHRRASFRRYRRRRRQEIVDIFLDVALDRIEVCRDLGRLAVLVAQFLHQMGDRKPGGLAIEHLHGIAVLALPQRHIAHDRLEFALNGFHLMLNALALGHRQLVEQFRRQHLAGARRGEGKTHRAAQEGDVLGLGPPLEGAEGRFTLLLELLLDGLAPRPVFVALEGRRQSGAQLIDQPLHRGGEPGARTRRKPQIPRPLRVVEIVDIAPVGWRRLALRPVSQQVFDHGVPAGTARSEGVDVVPFGADPHCEVERLDGPLLPDQPRRLFQLAAQLEWQLGRIAAAIQQRRRQGVPECKARAGGFSARRWLIVHRGAPPLDTRIFADGTARRHMGLILRTATRMIGCDRPARE